MSRLKFDPIFNFGHIITALSFFTIAVGAYYTVRVNVDNLADRMGRVELSIEKLTSVVTTDARQDERINALTIRIERIERAQEKAVLR